MSEILHLHPEAVSAQSFQEQVEHLASLPVTAQNLEQYQTMTLDRMVQLVREITDRYAATLSATAKIEFNDLSLREQEDTACEYWGVAQVRTLLVELQNRIEKIQQAKTVITGAEHTDTVYIPPQTRTAIQQTLLGEDIEENENERHHSQEPVSKAELVVFALLDHFGIDAAQIHVIKSDILERSFRKQPYYAIEAPSLQRLYVVCNEPANATFIFDTRVLQEHAIDSEWLLTQTKSQLRAIIDQYPHCGVSFFSTPHWYTHLLEHSEGVINPPLQLVDTEGTWKGLWTDPDTGKHWGSTGGLCELLKQYTWPDMSYALTSPRQMQQHTVRRFAQAAGLVTETIHIPPRNGSQIGYCFEDLLATEAVQQRLAHPDAGKQADGTYRYVDAAGKEWAPLNVLDEILGISTNTLELWMQDQQMSTLQCFVRGRLRTCYSLSEVLAIPSVQEHQAVPQVNGTGEWDGTYADADGKHWVSKEFLMNKLGMSFEAVTRHIQEKQVPSKVVRDRGNSKMTAYCFEEF